MELLNLGVSGYGTDDALDVLRRYGPELEPDLVLLGFTLGNDVRNNLLQGHCRLEEARLACEPLKPRRTPSIFANDSRFDSSSSSSPHRGLSMDTVGVKPPCGEELPAEARSRGLPAKGRSGLLRIATAISSIVVSASPMNAAMVNNVTIVIGTSSCAGREGG